MKKTVNQTIPSFTKYKTFEDACAFTGDDPTDKKFHDGEPDEVALRRCKVFTLAINGGKVMDATDTETVRYIPVFEYTPSGFRFDAAYGVDSSSRAGAGSRLCFLDRPRAEYAGKQFLKEYIPMQ